MQICDNCFCVAFSQLGFSLVRFILYDNMRMVTDSSMKRIESTQPIEMYKNYVKSSAHDGWKNSHYTQTHSFLCLLHLSLTHLIILFICVQLVYGWYI